MANLLKTTALSALILFAANAMALDPDVVFSKAAPSVVMVFGADSKERVQGSGVVVSPERVVTNCHVALVKNKRPHQKLVVTQGKVILPASYIAGNLSYDTCLLAVPGLTAPAIQLADLNTMRVGQRVYAIGAPVGLELTLTEGLISAFRSNEGSRIIQTSAAISHGSSGGGLFDNQARLIGITTFGRTDGNSLGFAYFADQIMGLVLAPIGSDDLKGVAASVQGALTKAVADSAPSRASSFRNPKEAADWLGEMGARLEASVPNAEYRNDLLRSIHYEATRAGIDPQLILGLIDTVSNFSKYQTDANGARGYMQVQPAWLDLIGRKGDSLFDLRTNLRFGCTILRHYLDMERGDLFRALMRYDVAMRMGPGQDMDDQAQRFPTKVREKWQSKWGYKGP